MIKIIIAPDSFKESLTAKRASQAIARGVINVLPKASIVQIPLADGGEGTLETLLLGMGGKKIKKRVKGPLGQPVEAEYILHNNQTATIEMARASGLPLVPPHKRNPMITTSLGTGELIRDALERGCWKIFLALGGVATSDAGIGMAQALGYRFLNSQGRSIPPHASGLLNLAHIDSSHKHPLIDKTKFFALCDVSNPLCGPHGSAKIYGPQKGATPPMVRLIEKAFRRFSEISKKDIKRDVINIFGAGAAGGAGAGAAVFLNAHLKRGVEFILDLLNIDQKLKGSNLVLTGEGRLDHQTSYGKAVAGLARRAKKYRIPVVALCGEIGPGAPLTLKQGVTAFFSIAPAPCTRQESLKNTGPWLTQKTEQVIRLYFSKDKIIL